MTRHPQIAERHSANRGRGGWGAGQIPTPDEVHNPSKSLHNAMHLRGSPPTAFGGTSAQPAPMRVERQACKQFFPEDASPPGKNSGGLSRAGSGPKPATSLSKGRLRSLVLRVRPRIILANPAGGRTISASHPDHGSQALVEKSVAQAFGLPFSTRRGNAFLSKCRRFLKAAPHRSRT